MTSEVIPPVRVPFFPEYRPDHLNSIKWLIALVLFALTVTACESIPTPMAIPTASSPVAPSPVVPSPVVPSSTLSETPTPSVSPTITPTPAGAWLSLNPTSGVPGTTVRVEGYLPGGLPEDQLKQENYQTYAEICWEGCLNGLQEQALEVNWSQTVPGHFSLQFVVPLIPWLANDGLHPLLPGEIPITLLNLNPNEICVPTDSSGKDCSAVSGINSTFHLTQGYAGTDCPNATSCGWMKITPGQAAPGDTVQVQGWAPLISIIGQPFGYSLALETSQKVSSFSDLYDLGAVEQSLDGSFKATFQVPQYASSNSPLSPGNYSLALNATSLNKGQTADNNLIPYLITPTQFEITASPEWTARSRSAPLWIQPSSSILDESVSIDPANPKRMAYCISGAVMASQDGGRSWVSIPTHSIKKVSLPGDLTVDPSVTPCTSVTLDSTHPDSYYAVFNTASKQYGAPPEYFIGLSTKDRGKTWQLVPVTQLINLSSMETGSFGGFWNNGQVVQALYYDTESNDPAHPAALQVKQTGDGGVSWTSASLSCPASGTCLRWGAAPSEISGMGADLPQDILASSDRGQSWNSTGQAAELRMTGPHELVALSPEEALLISGSASYPLLDTRDGGKTWQALALPPLPNANSGWGPGYPGLQMLPDGSLLAMNQDTGIWWALGPEAQDWCSTQVVSPGMYPSLLQSSGDRIWWLSASTGKLESASTSRFICQP